MRESRSVLAFIITCLWVANEKGLFKRVHENVGEQKGWLIVKIEEVDKCT